MVIVGRYGEMWGECGVSVGRVWGECWESVGRLWEVAHLVDHEEAERVDGEATEDVIRIDDITCHVSPREGKQGRVMDTWRHSQGVWSPRGYRVTWTSSRRRHR